MFAIYFVCLVSHTPLTPVNFATEHKQMLAHLHMLVNKDDNLNWFHRILMLDQNSLTSAFLVLIHGLRDLW